MSTDLTETRINFDEFWFDLRSGEKRLDEFPEDVILQATKLSSLNRQELQSFFDRGILLEKSSPQAGSPAPDFQLESVDHSGSRTGTTMQLTQSLDKPVALVFGSYT